MKSIKTLDESGVKCRSIIFVNQECYHYNYLKIKEKPKPIDGFFRLHIDKYSDDLGGWINYQTKLTKLKKDDNISDILLEVIQEITNEGIINLLQ